MKNVKKNRLRIYFIFFGGISYAFPNFHFDILQCPPVGIDGETNVL